MKRAAGIPLKVRWASATAPLRLRWQAMSPRERYLSTLAASAVGILLVWAIALAPALGMLQKVQTQRVVLDAQMQQMLSMQAEARQLAAQPRIGRDVALKALQDSVAALGSEAQLQVSGERATITLRGVTAVNVAAWIGQARTNARVAPVEVRLVRSAARPAAAPAGNAGAAAARTGGRPAPIAIPPGSSLAAEIAATGGVPPASLLANPAAAAATTPPPLRNQDIRWDGTLVVNLPAA